MNNIFINDFEYIVNIINSCHPLGCIGFNEKYLNCIKKQRETVIDYNSMITSMSILTTALNDAHTNIELPYLNDDLCLNIPCMWFDNELYVINNYSLFLKGDKIQSVENVYIEDYFKKLCNFIPHENEFVIRTRSTKYPYKNYHLFSQFNLNNIIDIKSNILNITIERQNKILTIKAPLENYIGFIKFDEKTEFIKYKFIKNLGILIIDECKYNDIYCNKLKEFFKLVKEKNINYIVLDIRENMGGNSSVIQEFLKYIDVDEYYFYDIFIREYDKDLQHTFSRNDKIKNEKVTDNFYSGKISCLVSNTTFSSARMFATVLKDNNIADIIGEKTGGKPTSFGAPSKFITPDFKIKFRVSARLFKRPDFTKDDDNCLEPDIIITQSINDFLDDKDSALSFIIKE